jgi:archaellum component FlaC
VPAPDDAPARVGDLRTLRRWLLVAGVWAVAATAIAVIALIAANDDSESRAANEQAAGDLARVQRDLNKRMDDLEGRLDELPSSDDLTKLDDRLQKVEDDASATSDSIERLSGRVEEVETQLEELEQAVAAGGGTDTTETTP